MLYLLAGSVVWSGLGSWIREFPPPLFLLFLCCVRVACHLLGGTCNRLNSLSLLMYRSYCFPINEICAQARSRKKKLKNNHIEVEKSLEHTRHSDKSLEHTERLHSTVCSKQLDQ